MLDIYKHMDLKICKLAIHMQFRRRWKEILPAFMDRATQYNRFTENRLLNLEIWKKNSNKIFVKN
jgi:hypothetical protein